MSVIISAVFVANALGLFPDAKTEVSKGRVALCEVIGLGCSHGVARKDRQLIGETLAMAVRRNSEILAARLVKANGSTLTGEGQLSCFETNGSDIARVPIAANAKKWGELQVAFEKSAPLHIKEILTAPVTRFALVLGSLCGLVFQFYLKRILTHLDPTRVVPDRVRSTLDTLAEGLVVLDRENQIVLANQAFADTMDREADELQGLDVAGFAWKNPNTNAFPENFPWVDAILNQRVVTGAVLQLDVPNQKSRKFRVSCSPVVNNGEDCQGALVSFDDVTALEARTNELTSMLEKLKKSRDKIRLQNQQLVTLATRDPLTGAFNRRSLFENLDDYWKSHHQTGQSLCCIMADIDHFKSVNDTHGHAAGDVVLKETVRIFHSIARPEDIVGRFGGEEFCIVFPNTSLEKTIEIANEIRVAMESTDFSGVKCTASFGAAQMTADTVTPADMIECADKSLYVAKRTGRNRVISFPELEHLDKIEIVNESVASSTPESAIPFQTVAALTAALAYRDVSTAQHCRRVADNCFKLGSTMMSISASYILENAALLHDIGKIGVPDSILLKPDSLSQEEWVIMRTHDDIGVEIIRSTFACDELTAIVEMHHARYGGAENNPEVPSGKDIPIGARILTIADSYDAMISDRVYRKGLSQGEAVAELRRCAGSQFDPELVEEFVAMVLEEAKSKSANSELRPEMARADKQAALRIGIQIEDLAQALDDQDGERLATVATAIAETAIKYDVREVAQLATELANSVTSDSQWVEHLELSIELMEFCRLTQQSHLNVSAQTEELPNAMSLANDLSMEAVTFSEV